MKEVDPGHEYLLDSYDGGDPVRLVFVKREGEGYPFNVGHHPGTNCQEVIRALIHRVKYLQKQIPCEENEHVITGLRSCLWSFEQRAAKRHGRASVLPWQEQYQSIPIEEQPTCTGCGHVGCEGNHKFAAPAPPVQPEGERERLKLARRIIDAVVKSPCVVEARFFSQPEEQEKLETQIAAMLTVTPPSTTTVAPKCVRCGHDDDVDENGVCRNTNYDASTTSCLCHGCLCKCEFAEPVTAPRCSKCGYVMCQQFDSRPVNAVAEIATPNGKYVCYHCEDVTTTAAARAAADEIARLIQDEYEHGAVSIEPKIAAIITRYCSPAAVVAAGEYPEVQCCGCKKTTDTGLLLCPTCVDNSIKESVATALRNPVEGESK